MRGKMKREDFYYILHKENRKKTKSYVSLCWTLSTKYLLLHLILQQLYKVDSMVTLTPFTDDETESHQG